MRVCLVARKAMVVAALLAASGCSSGPDGTGLVVEGQDVAAPDDSVEDAAGSGPCIPNCAGKECGSSGCPGYSCGSCFPGWFCNESFVCAVGVCTAGTTKCEDGGLATCLPDGSGWGAPADCGVNMICVKGECVDKSDFCEPGTSQCDGDGVAICGEDGKSWGPAVPCRDGKKCVDGKCIGADLVCNPGDRKCAAGGIVTCAADGKAWGVAQPCPAGTQCLDGECVALPPANCDGVLQCMLQKNCGDAQASCLEECFAAATEPAKQLAMAIYNCEFTLCGKWGPGEPCFQTQRITGCAAPFQACQAQTCTPDCLGKECGPDGCGNQCGTCGSDESCVSSACVPNSGGCDGISYEGCCDGGILKWCENGKLKSENCGGQGKCGWDVKRGFYNCGTDGQADPSGTFPLACWGSCVPNCSGKQCGDNGCGGVCGLCGSGQECIQGICSTSSTSYSCAQIVTCAIGCGFQDSCLWGCYDKGDEQAKQLFQSLLTCIGQVCGFYVTEQCIWSAVGNQCKQAYELCTDD